MTKKIKTAVIGCGVMGKNHLRIYSEISELVAVADINPAVGNRVAKQFGIRFYPSYQELLATEKPGAVSVVVPTFLHKQVAIDCLNQGIPTLVEKPIAITTQEADLMMKQATEKKVLLMVGHVERFNPAVIKLKKLMDQKKLGKIISLLAVRVGIVPPKTPESDVALDLGIHDVDVFNYLMNEYPVHAEVKRQKLFANNVADSAVVSLQYKQALGVIQTNWMTPIKKRALYITGTEGFAELDYIKQKLVVYDKLMDVKPAGDFFELLTKFDSGMKRVYRFRKEPLKEELKYFLKHIHTRNLKATKAAIQALKIVQL